MSEEELAEILRKCGATLRQTRKITQRFSPSVIRALLIRANLPTTEEVIRVNAEVLRKRFAESIDSTEPGGISWDEIIKRYGS